MRVVLGWVLLLTSFVASSSVDPPGPPNDAPGWPPLSRSAIIVSLNTRSSPI